MKILFPIGTLYPSQAGGPSNTIYWMAKALVQQGTAVSLVTTSDGIAEQVGTNRWLSTDYGHVIYLDAWIHELPWRMLATAVNQVTKHDCVHLNSLFYPPSFLVAIVALWKKKAIIWSCRGNLHPHALIYSRWKKRPVLWMLRQFFANHPGIVFHGTSAEECAQIKQALGAAAKTVDVPNYLELPPLQVRPAIAPLYFLYVGRLHAIKAVDALLSASALSATFKASDYLLKIAGEGDPVYVNKLKTQIERLNLQDRVQFLGLVEGELKQQLFAGAHFTILPSHSENFGNVVIESLAQGTPVIASTGTPWQILETEQAGFWVDNTPARLSEVIDQILNWKPAIYITYRYRAGQVAKQFDVFKNIHHWMDIYADNINKTKYVH